jgi:Zn-dependent protease with chaperone function
MELTGIYFDGKSSHPRQATVYFDGEFIHIVGQDKTVIHVAPFSQCSISPALGKTRRSLRLPDQAKFEFDKQEAAEELERFSQKTEGLRFVNFLESRWKMVGIITMALIACVYLFMITGIPLFARITASYLPPAALEGLSSQTLTLLDRQFLEPSELSQQKSAELRDTFRRITSEIGQGYHYRLELRKGGPVGANAFALPSGIIVMTDELAGIAGNDKEISGVLAHEITHVNNRHGMRSILQDAGVFLIISILAGDVTSITSMAASLPTVLVQSGYSREFEREADEGAGLYLIRKGWGTKPYQDMLARLEKEHHEYPGPAWIATHPGTGERIKQMALLEKKSRQ